MTSWKIPTLVLLCTCRWLPAFVATCSGGIVFRTGTCQVALRNSALTEIHTYDGLREPLLAHLENVHRTGALSLTVVHDDDVQAVEQLPLVLVDPLHVHVEHGRRVYLHPVLVLQVLGEFHLVVL